MKIKNINRSLWILSCLIILSFSFLVSAQEKSGAANIFLDSDQDGLTDAEEKLYGTNPHNPDTDGDGYSDGAEVKSGFDPTIPAPGDKISNASASAASDSAAVVSDEKQISDDPAASGAEASNTDNLTQQVAQKITDLTTNSQSGDVSMDDVQGIINDVLDAQTTTVELPEVDASEMKIKKQNYDKLGDDEAKKRKTEDFISYISQVFYIIASNSPEPITSGTDATTSLTSTFQQVSLAITTQNPDLLNGLSDSGSKILEQLKEVEVPEDLVDLHTKALQYAMYAQSLKGYLKQNADDPIAGIKNMSQITAYIQSVMSFTSDIQAKFNEYDVDYSAIQDKIKGYGIDLPGLDDLNNIDLTGSGGSSSSSSSGSSSN